jgi:hypothetical protein
VTTMQQNIDQDFAQLMGLLKNTPRGHWVAPPGPCKDLCGRTLDTFQVCSVRLATL